MNGGVVNLVVSGPIPGCVRGDAESAAALARELHARTILHVDRPGADGPSSPAPSAADDHTDSGEQNGSGPLGRKGGGAESFAELVVTGLFSATTVAAFAQVAVAFVQRGAARRITFRDGRRTLTISMPSDETEQLVAEWLGIPPTQSGAGSGAD